MTAIFDLDSVRAAPVNVLLLDKAAAAKRTAQRLHACGSRQLAPTPLSASATLALATPTRQVSLHEKMRTLQDTLVLPPLPGPELLRRCWKARVSVAEQPAQRLRPQSEAGGTVVLEVEASNRTSQARATLRGAGQLFSLGCR